MTITVKEFLETLNDKERNDVETSFARDREWYAAQTEGHIIQVLIRNILWNYKTLLEYCWDPQQAKKYARRKAEVYEAWKKLGLVE